MLSSSMTLPLGSGMCAQTTPTAGAGTGAGVGPESESGTPTSSSAFGGTAPSSAAAAVHGVVPRCAERLFAVLEAAECSTTHTQSQSRVVETSVHCQFLQIYNEKIYDLLVDKRMSNPLQLRENGSGGKGVRGVHVQGISEYRVACMDDVLGLVRDGLRNRAVRATELNAESSRSHSILQLHVQVESRDEVGEGEEREGEESGIRVVRRSTISLVDLAGSEKASTEADGILATHVDAEKSASQHRETANINTSLHTLGTCVAALAEKSRKHVPFRNSVLTRLLQTTLAGLGRTYLLANVRAGSRFVDETYNTLQFAARAAALKVDVRPTEATMDGLSLLNARRQIVHLKARLSEMRVPSPTCSSCEMLRAEVAMLRKCLEGQGVQYGKQLHMPGHARSLTCSSADASEGACHDAAGHANEGERHVAAPPKIVSLPEQGRKGEDDLNLQDHLPASYVPEPAPAPTLVCPRDVKLDSPSKVLLRYSGQGSVVSRHWAARTSADGDTKTTPRASVDESDEHSTGSRDSTARLIRASEKLLAGGVGIADSPVRRAMQHNSSHMSPSSALVAANALESDGMDVGVLFSSPLMNPSNTTNAVKRDEKDNDEAVSGRDQSEASAASAADLIRAALNVSLPSVNVPALDTSADVTAMEEFEYAKDTPSTSAATAIPGYAASVHSGGTGSGADDEGTRETRVSISGGGSGGDAHLRNLHGNGDVDETITTTTTNAPVGVSGVLRLRSREKESIQVNPQNQAPTVVAPAPAPAAAVSMLSFLPTPVT